MPAFSFSGIMVRVVLAHFLIIGETILCPIKRPWSTLQDQILDRGARASRICHIYGVMIAGND